MSASDTDICNDALVALGQAKISALSDPGVAARQCKGLYPLRRDELLREYDWNFARTLAALPALSDAPIFGATLAYQLPGDCLALRGTDHDDCDPERFAWEVRAGTIVTCLGAPLNIIYTRAETDTALMDSLFTTALACRIRRDLAIPLTNSIANKNDANNDYQAAISKARGASFREIARREEMTSWLRARF